LEVATTATPKIRAGRFYSKLRRLNHFQYGSESDSSSKPVNLDFDYIAGSRERGAREAAKYYEENMKMFGPLRLVRALTDQQIEDMADPRKAPHAGLPTIEEAIDKGGVLCGSPEQIIEHLKKLEVAYPGLERISVSLSVGVPEAVALEQLERFATEVMPAFKTAAAEPALAD